MGTFGNGERSPFEDHANGADQTLFRVRVFLQQDARKGVHFLRVTPKHVEKPAAAIGVVKQRGIKATAIHVNRLRPWTTDVQRGYQIVVGVFVRTDHASDIGVDKIEQTISIAKARSPYAAGIRVAPDIQLAHPGQRISAVPPVHQIARMVDAYTRPPFERGGRNVIVIADAQDRRIGMTAGKNRIENVCHSTSDVAGRCGPDLENRDCRPHHIVEGFPS